MRKAESHRLHLDWWGKCRTCKWWNSSERGNLDLASCMCEASSLYLSRPTSSGRCPEWDSFDVDTALEIMEADEARKGR